MPSPYDPSEPDRAYFNTADGGELSRYGAFYASRYITSDQLADTDLMASHLIELARGTGQLQLFTNKGQAQASTWAREELAKTPGHPSVAEAEILMITAAYIMSYLLLLKLPPQMLKIGSVGVELQNGSSAPF